MSAGTCLLSRCSETVIVYLPILQKKSVMIEKFRKTGTEWQLKEENIFLFKKL
jgi:hypothetical protein